MTEVIHPNNLPSSFGWEHLTRILHWENSLPTTEICRAEGRNLYTMPPVGTAAATPKTLLVTNDFPPRLGGIQVVQRELFGALDPDRLLVIASDHPDAASYDAAQPFRLQRVPRNSMIVPFQLRGKLREAIHDFAPDVVVFGSGWLSSLHPVAEAAGVPYVTMVYGADVPIPAAIPGLALWLRAGLRASSGIVAMGPWVANEARRALGSEPIPPILTVFPGVDTDEFTPGDKQAARRSLGLDPVRPTIASVSRLVPRKGMHLLVDAAAELVSDYPDLQVAIGGTGREESRLRRLIASKNLESNVLLLGRVPQSKLPDLYRSADVATMLCHDRWFGLEQEGFGIVFIEAAACGTPVVAGRSGGATDAVTDMVTGTVVDANNRQDVGAALRMYLDNPDRAQQVGAAGREAAESVFQWSIQSEAFATWMSEQFT